MGSKIGNLKNRLMQSKKIQRMIHFDIKNDKTKIKHNADRNSLFHKISSKVNKFKKIIKPNAPPEDVGKSVVDIIEPIATNITSTPLTEDDFKKDFFQSLCGGSFDRTHDNPAAFFINNHKLSIRQEALPDSDIRDIADCFKDTSPYRTAIETEFTNRFPHTIGGGTATKGELIVGYMKEIANEFKYKDPSRFNPKQGSSSISADFLARLKELDTIHTKTAGTIETLKRSIHGLNSTSDRLDDINAQIQSGKINPQEVSEAAIQEIQKIMTNLSASVQYLNINTKAFKKDVDTAQRDLNEKLKKAEKELADTTKKCGIFMSSKEYQETTDLTKKELTKYITSFENLQETYDDLLKIAEKAKDYAENKHNKNPTDTTAQTELNKATQNHQNIQNRKTEIDTKLGELRTHKETLEGAMLKQRLIAESRKLANVFDVPEDPINIQTLLDNFRTSLNDEVKDIPDIDKKQALQDSVNALEDELTPLELLSLYSGLLPYPNPTDGTQPIALNFKNGNLQNLLTQKSRLQHHLTNNTPHTINLNTPPNALPDRQINTLFASNGTEHKAINITKTAADIFQITTHDFNGDPKNATSYTLDASQIKDAQDYLNEILKTEKGIYPKFSDIDTDLNRFIHAKGVILPPPPPPPSITLDYATIAPMLADYWVLDDATQATKATTFNILNPDNVTIDTEKAKTLTDDFTKASAHPLEKMALHDILKTSVMTEEREQRKALRNIILSSATEPKPSKPIQFDKIIKMPRKVGPVRIGNISNDCKPLLFASDGTGQHLKINISRGQSHYYITCENFPDTKKTPKQEITIDASQINNAENYINKLYREENKNHPDLNDVQKTIQSFSDYIYITPKDTKTLTPDMINKIHHELYEKDNIIESHWTVSDNLNDAGRKSINEKFDQLFPNKETYDDFYTRVRNDGQPLTTLALKYLAHSKWHTEGFHLENETFVALLHDGRRKLFDEDNHDGDNIKWDNIFEDNGDTVLLEFHNDSKAKSASNGHYTGALIQKTGDNDYKITTINTLREYDNEYTISSAPNKYDIMSQIYAKSTRGKNSKNNLRKKQIEDIKKILNNTISKTKLQEIEKILKGSDPKTKFKEIETILDKAIPETKIQEIKHILENTIPETNIRDIEKILTDAAIPPIQTSRHDIQTGFRCGIDMVDRAIEFLKKTDAIRITEDKKLEEDILKKATDDGETDEQKRESILNNTHNKKLQRQVLHNGDTIILPQPFILDRYLTRDPYIADPSNPTTKENEAIDKISAKLKNSTIKIKDAFKLNDATRILFGDEKGCINDYITSHAKTDPINAIALLDYQEAMLGTENFKPFLIKSMQEGRKYQSILSSASTTEDQKNPFTSNESTSFLFKTSNTDHTVVTIIPKDGTHFISFVNSENNQQHIFAIPEVDKDTIKNTINILVEDYSEKLRFNRDDIKTFPPNKPDLARRELENFKNILSHSTPDNLNNLTNNVSYLEHVNSFIKDPIFYPLHNKIKNEYAEKLADCWDDIIVSIQHNEGIWKDINPIGDTIWQTRERCKDYQKEYSPDDPKHYIIASLYAQESNAIPQTTKDFIVLRNQTENNHAEGTDFSHDLFNEGNLYSAIFIAKSQSDNPACPFAPILITKNLNDTYNLVMREDDCLFTRENIQQNQIEDLYNRAKNNDVVLRDMDEPIPELFNAADKRNYRGASFRYTDSTRMFDGIIKFELNQRLKDTINNMKEAIDQGKEYDAPPNVIDNFFKNTDNYLEPNYILPMYIKMLRQRTFFDMDEEIENDNKIQSLQTIMQNRDHTKTATTLDTLFPNTPETEGQPFGIFFTQTGDVPIRQSSFKCYRLQKNADTNNYTLTLSQMGHRTQEFTIPDENIENIYNSLKFYDMEIPRDPNIERPDSLWNQIQAIPANIRNQKSQDPPNDIYDLMLSLENPLPLTEVPEPEASPREGTP